MTITSDLNYITGTMHHPCKSGGFGLVAMAAARAAFTGVATFHLFDCNDLVAEKGKQLREGAGFPNGHRSVSGKGAKGQKSTVNGVGGMAWDGVVIPARTLGSAFFIFGIAIHAFADFKSLMYNESGCNDSNGQYRSGPAGAPFVYIAGFGGKLLLDGPVGHGCIFAGFDKITISPGCTGGLSWSGSFVPADPATCTSGSVTGQVFSSLGGAGQQVGYNTGADGPGNNLTSFMKGVQGGLLDGETLWVDVHAEGCNMKLTTGAWNASAGGRPVPLLGYGGCPGADLANPPG